MKMDILHRLAASTDASAFRQLVQLGDGRLVAGRLFMVCWRACDAPGEHLDPDTEPGADFPPELRQHLDAGVGLDYQPLPPLAELPLIGHPAARCKACDGNGANGLCWTCDGEGVVQDANGQDYPCRSCDGTKRTEVCSHCYAGWAIPERGEPSAYRIGDLFIGAALLSLALEGAEGEVTWARGPDAMGGTSIDSLHLRWPTGGAVLAALKHP